MEVMQADIIGVLGGVITFLLGVNAFYFRSITKEISDIRVILSKISAEHDINITTIRDNKREIDRLRDKIHALEGSQSQLMAYVEDLKE